MKSRLPRYFLCCCVIGILPGIGIHLSSGQTRQNKVLILKPPVTIRGQVINAATKKPMARIPVKLRMPQSDQRPMFSMTGKDGKFTFEASPLAKNWEINVQEKGFTKVRAQLLNRNIASGTPSRVFRLKLALRPEVTVRGQVVDVETNRPPVAGISIGAYPLGVASKQGPFTVFEQQAATSMKPNGSFEIQVGAGSYRFKTATYFLFLYDHKSSLSELPVYHLETPLETPREWEVSTQGLKNVQLRLRKNPGVLFSVELSRTSNLGASPTIEVRTADGKVREFGHSYSSHCYVPTAKWGDAVEVRALNFKQELVPWTRCTADGATWPVKIHPPVQDRTIAPQPGEALKLFGKRQITGK